MESGTVIEHNPVDRTGKISSDHDGTEYTFRFGSDEPPAVDDKVMFAVGQVYGCTEAVDVCKQVQPMKTGTVTDYIADRHVGSVSADDDGTEYVFHYHLSQPLAVDDKVTFTVTDVYGEIGATHVCPL